ncbi:hypothetical protein HUX88_24340 [Duganella sp. BJB1802]|nr:hypothetical protein [Duganella sp. BJB1802]
MRAAVVRLHLRGITLLMHDFGGPVGMGLAARHPERIARVISANGPTPFGQPDLSSRLIAKAQVSPWFQWILKAESKQRLDARLCRALRRASRLPGRDRPGKGICDRRASIRNARRRGYSRTRRCIRCRAWAITALKMRPKR